MPTKPSIVTLTNSSVDVLNAIRNSATQNYRDYVPIATPDADSIRKIGTVIMDYPNLQNEFISTLVNRIGRVIVTSKTYENPWSVFKKGMLEFGETIEEIFVNIAEPFTFDQSIAEKEVFKREIPDVKSAFHVMNYQKYYKVTISNDQLRQAFLSWDGITDLISKIVETLYTSANYDEFQTMKYMLAVRMLNGQMHTVDIPELSKETIHEVVTTIKATSNAFEFQKTDYNLAGVYTHTKKNEQYLIVNSRFDAQMDVEVLASAFNMDKAEFSGHRILVDGFGDLDIPRLNKLFYGDSTYREISQNELDALNKIPCILVDKDFFMIFDNFQNFTEQYNGEGLYWNYWYHVWKTFSISPFSNNTLFTPTKAQVTSVTINPSEVTTTVNTTVNLSATVETVGFALQSVTWDIIAGDATVDSQGNVKIPETASGTITVKATSVYDTSKFDECTITIV